MPPQSVDLICPSCGSNRLRIPQADEDVVACEDCGAAVQSLRAAKAQVEDAIIRTLAGRAPLGGT